MEQIVTDPRTPLAEEEPIFVQQKSSLRLSGAIVGCCLSICAQIFAVVLLNIHPTLLVPEIEQTGEIIFQSLDPPIKKTFLSANIKPDKIFYPYVSWEMDFLVAISVFQAAFTVLGICGIHRARLKKRRNTMLEFYCAAQFFCAIAFALIVITRRTAQDRFAPAIVYHLALEYPIIARAERLLSCCGAYGYKDYIENPDIWWLWQVTSTRPEVSPSVPATCCRENLECTRNPSSSNTHRPCGEKIVFLLELFDQSTVATILNLLPAGFAAVAVFGGFTAAILIHMRRQKTKN